jgi:hypothetical protein
MVQLVCDGPDLEHGGQPEDLRDRQLGSTGRVTLALLGASHGEAQLCVCTVLRKEQPDITG